MNIKELGENIGLDEEEYIEMLAIFIESGSEDIEKLENAIKEGSSEKAHQASHSLKGSSGNMGLDALFKLAKAVDDKVRDGVMDGIESMLKEIRQEHEKIIQEYNKHT